MLYFKDLCYFYYAVLSAVDITSKRLMQPRDVSTLLNMTAWLQYGTSKYNKQTLACICHFERSIAQSKNLKTCSLYVSADRLKSPLRRGDVAAGDREVLYTKLKTFPSTYVPTLPLQGGLYIGIIKTMSFRPNAVRREI